MKTSNPCIVLFVYNRPDHTQRMLESLTKCEDVHELPITVFIDGPRDNKDFENVTSVIQTVKCFDNLLNMKIVSRQSNIGLAASVISGVSETLESHSSVIVLEDDLIFHPQFLVYMKLALNFYEEEKNIFSISGYLPELNWEKEERFTTNLFPRIHSWGWATWKDRWKEVDWSSRASVEFIQNCEWVDFFLSGGDDLLQMLKDQIHGKNNSWAIRFNLAAAKNQRYTVYPNQTLVLNRGFDGTGVHCGLDSKIQEQRFYSQSLEIDKSNFIDFPISEKINKFRTNYE